MNNNPLKYNDPSGHSPCADWGACAGQTTNIASVYDPSSDLKIDLELGLKSGTSQISMPESSNKDYAYVLDPATGYQTVKEPDPVALTGSGLVVLADYAAPYADANNYRNAPANISVNVNIDAYQNPWSPTTWNYVPKKATVINNSSGPYNPVSLKVGNSQTPLGCLLQPGESASYNLNDQPTTVSFGESLSVSTYGRTYPGVGNDPGTRWSSASLFQDSLDYLFRIVFSP